VKADFFQKMSIFPHRSYLKINGLFALVVPFGVMYEPLKSGKIVYERKK